MNSKFINIFTCWCGSEELANLSEYYKQCEKCGTLIRTPRPTDNYYNLYDDYSDFYGRNYWIEHQTQRYNQPNIFNRSRDDISTRCLYWLMTLLTYRLPPAKSLEIGCAHGGLVLLMKELGFNAIGCEISPWIVEYAINTFDIPVYCGRLEDLDIVPSYFDCIILLDVLEHFIDPKGMMDKISRILKPTGIVIIQTPCYRNEGPTWSQMKEDEHLYLFTEDGLKLLLKDVGFADIVTEPQLFPYDMFIIAGKSKLLKLSEEAVVDCLLTYPNGRILLAMFDLYRQRQDLEERLKESDADRAVRLENMKKLENWLKESESDKSSLANRLKESESDKSSLANRLKESEDRLKKIESSLPFNLLKRLKAI